MNKSILFLSFLIVLTLHYCFLTTIQNKTITNANKNTNNTTTVHLAKLVVPEIITQKKVLEQQVKEKQKKQNPEKKRVPKNKVENKPVKEFSKNIVNISEDKKEPNNIEKNETQKENIIPKIKAIPEQIVEKSIDENKFKDEYTKQLREEIDKNKSYPSISKRLNEEGKVIVYFKVLRNGLFKDIKIVDSSGKDRLDKAALQALYTTKQYKPFYKYSNKEYLDFNLPLIFRLN